MQTWRVAGLVLAVLSFGSIGGCGDGGGGGDEPDADETDASDEDSGSGGRKDGGTDGGMDGGDEEDADVICVPKGCSDLGAECGEPDDGCGNSLDCGDDCVDPNDPATDYFTCGGGGEEYKCGCTPKTCDDALICGTLPDDCGGEIACGDECEGDHNTCGGGGKPNECGCAPELGACGDAQCGTADDGCGNTVQCGSHGGGCSEARACDGSKQCACKPEAELCAGRCGNVNIDGCPAACGACDRECNAGEACANCTCSGAGVCSNNACCAPEPQATTCGSDVCGTKTNNCGQTVSCGSCTGQAQCTQGQCVDDPRTSALVGRYAMRSITFSYDPMGGQGSRSEGYALVDISLQGAQLVMRERACLSRVFGKLGNDPELSQPVAVIKAAVAENFPTIETTLDLTGTRDVPGVKEWFRDRPTLATSGLGWRPGRPSYCPAPTAEVPQPAPSASLPGYGDTGGRGAKKPWLGDADCRCPEAEIAQPGHEPCRSNTTPESQRAACMADWINLSIPYQTSREPGDVTDCRVIDEDGDGQPGITIDGKATLGPFTLGTAKLYSAATLANYFYGDIDESGARLHKGVVMDLPQARNSVLACGEVTLAGNTLCNTSTFRICPPFRDDEGSIRGNPVDLVPLEQKQPPAGSSSWTCAAFESDAVRASLFPPAQFPSYSNNYPPADKCAVPM